MSARREEEKERGEKNPAENGSKKKKTSEPEDAKTHFFVLAL